MPGALTADRYGEILRVVHGMRYSARRLIDELDAAIAAIDRAEAVGPMLDPTLFIRSAGFMMQDCEVLVAVRALAELGPCVVEDLTGGGMFSPVAAGAGDGDGAGDPDREFERS